MSVAEASAAGRDEKLGQIERIVHSPGLRGSDSLCALLRYLANHALQHPGESLKEQQIAVEVFGRPAPFDPRLDSTVRVQTSRLRAKLGDYYRSAGADDPVVVEIPRGTYMLTFESRGGDASESTPPAEPQPSAAPEPIAKLDRRWFFAFCAASALAVALGAALLLRQPRSEPPITASPALRQFWAGFTGNPEPPWVIYSNAEFAGRPDSDMHYYDAQRDAGLPIMDHYTGVGEVLAIHDLDMLFSSLNHPVRVKRGRLLSLDDVKNNNLIFVGSPSENLTLREIPGTSEFQFRTLTDGPRKGSVTILNLHPRPGEPPSWLASMIPLSEDYAMVALVGDINPTYRVMIVAGTTTLGTQAAVEYVCREQSVKELLARAGSSPAGVRPFEAVLHVDVKGGVPVGSRMVAFRSPNS